MVIIREIEDVDYVSCRIVGPFAGAPQKYECDLYRRVPAGHLEKITTVRVHDIEGVNPNDFKVYAPEETVEFSYRKGKCRISSMWDRKAMYCYK